MANKEKLPWDLIEEILSRVPTKSLVRFRTVCKLWNALFDDNTFINNHKKTFRFILFLTTKSKIYSVSVNPTIEVRELTLDIPALESKSPSYLINCDGLLLCDMGEGAVVWNPWLKQTRWIEPDGDQPRFQINGIGYDDNGYKTLASCQSETAPYTTFWKTHDFSSHAWKDLSHEMTSSGSSISTQEIMDGPQNIVDEPFILQQTTSGLSLNGTWYQVSYYENIKKYFFIVNFDFSTESFYKFCELPCEDNTHQDALVLSVFKGDRFSLLKQSHLTKKIQIWVNKNKIHKQGGRDVEWVSFMEVSVPNLPDLAKTGSYSQPSYFIENKRLVVCSCDETGRAWIYVMRNNNLISKIKIDLVVDLWPLHCSFIPSLVSVPGRQREEDAEVVQDNFSFGWPFVWLFRKLKFFFGKLNYFKLFRVD